MILPRYSALFSLQKRGLQEDLRAAFQDLKGVYKKSVEGLFTRAYNDRTKGGWLQAVRGEI